MFLKTNPNVAAVGAFMYSKHSILFFCKKNNCRQRSVSYGRGLNVNTCVTKLMVDRHDS